MKRFISLLLVFCLAFPTAFAEEAQEPQSKWDSVREWLNQAAEGSSERASEIWSSVSEWVTQTWSEVSG